MRSTRSIVWALLMILLLGFGLLAQQAVWHSYFWWDLRLAQEIQTWKVPGFHYLMVGVSFPGNGWNAWVLTISIGLALMHFGRRRDGGILLAGIGLGAFFNSLLKSWIARPRPGDDLVQVWIDYPGLSFPSGHVALYMELFGFLLYLAIGSDLPDALRKVVVVSLAIPPLLVGISRVYLGAHWPSDVVGGYLYGMFWLILMIGAQRRFRA